jgi:hypothetical protein
MKSTSSVAHSVEDTNGKALSNSASNSDLERAARAALERRIMCVFPHPAYLCADNWPFFRRRVDLRMLPLLGVLYSLALIDRTNLGIARVAGMEKDLVSPTKVRYCKE